MSAHYVFETVELKERLLYWLEDAVQQAQIEFVRIIKHILSQPGRGVWYKGAPAQSSLRGHPPAVQTGNLRASWGVIRPLLRKKRSVVGGINQRAISSLGASPVKYAFWLEYGTRHMDKRPFVAPAVASTEKWLNGYIMKKSLVWWAAEAEHMQNRIDARRQQYLRNLSKFL